jgi:hypothetical protein
MSVAISSKLRRSSFMAATLLLFTVASRAGDLSVPYSAMSNLKRRWASQVSALRSRATPGRNKLQTSTASRSSAVFHPGSIGSRLVWPVLAMTPLMYVSGMTRANLTWCFGGHRITPVSSLMHRQAHPASSGELLSDPPAPEFGELESKFQRRPESRGLRRARTASAGSRSAIYRTIDMCCGCRMAVISSGPLWSCTVIAGRI